MKHATLIAALSVAPVVAIPLATADHHDRAPATKPAEGTIDRLQGTWRDEAVSTSAGDVQLTVTFEKRGQVDIVATSKLPLVGEVKDKEYAYRVTDEHIVVQKPDGEEEIPYHFDGDTLVLKYEGRTARLERVEG